MPVNLFENVSAGEASRQVIVSTTGIHITASTVTTEAGVMQCLGQLSDTSISQISRDHTATSTSQQEAKGCRICSQSRTRCIRKGQVMLPIDGLRERSPSLLGSDRCCVSQSWLLAWIHARRRICSKQRVS
ncbi:hypothetical protein DL98DRAFT_661829 [Cadophora sp. DSE1049]|nr:hypothetical protein DL98DRAFT_661829 [Cadophora sp. DSE1049]